MSDDDFQHDEPANTKVRSEFANNDEVRKFLDTGGHVEADEEMLYRHMRESQRRLMVMLPVLLSVGIEHMRSNQGLDVSEDIQIALDRSAQLATRYLNPVTRAQTVDTIVRDAQRVLVAMNADSIQQAVLAAAFLTIALTEKGSVADPTAQTVLVSMAILEEAENDSQQGIRGTWHYETGKLSGMADEGALKLSLAGYL